MASGRFIELSRSDVKVILTVTSDLGEICNFPIGPDNRALRGSGNLVSSYDDVTRLANVKRECLRVLGTSW